VETSGDSSRLKLFALHKHFLAADAIKQFMLTPVRVPDNTNLPKEWLDLAQFHSASLRICVFYGLLYVVIEGYKELGGHDDAVDKLVAQDHYVDALRRFRNAVFHYQEDPYSPKLIEFLGAKDSEHWVSELYAALKVFFERSLRIKESLERYRREVSRSEGTDTLFSEH
jgi:hypothetical protein